MKKIAICFFAAAIVAAAVPMIGCNTVKPDNNQSDANVPEYKVTYFDGENVLFFVNCKKNGYAENFTLEDKNTYVFTGWQCDGEQYEFNTPVVSDLDLYASWTPTGENVPPLTDQPTEKPDDKEEKPSEIKPRIVKVNYLSDVGLLFCKEIEYGAQAENIPMEDSPDYVFSGWQSDGKNYDFSQPVITDLNLYATYSAVEHLLEFADGDFIVAVRRFTADNKQIDIPEVPEKDGYTGEWESFELKSGNIRVYAVYTPIDYTVSFRADGETVAEFTYNAEDKSFTEPQVPHKDGYVGAWENYVLNGNVTVNAVYTPIIYKVNFYADGVLRDTQTYTVEKREITLPEIPAKAFYNGVWNSFELTYGDIAVNAIYTPIRYTVQFIAEEEKVFEQTYTVENKVITLPEVPEKEGYDGAWESFELTCGDIEVNAVYTPIVYKIAFYAEGALVDTKAYTVENKQITPPEIPQKVGYTAKWQDFELSYGDLQVNAEYTPVEYAVYFYADGVLTDKVIYTVENVDINVPEVPQKYGYNGKWQEFLLDGGDKIVNAVYSSSIHNVYFYADGKLVYQMEYADGDTEIALPKVPGKKGYDAKWEDFVLSGGDVTVRAEYTPIQYVILFCADDVPVATVRYTIEDTEVTLPEVPHKDGYTGKWADFELDCSYLMVNAIYTKKEDPNPPVTSNPPVDSEKPDTPVTPVDPEKPENPDTPVDPTEADVENLIYEENENGLVITGYKGDFKKLFIPSEIGGKNVYALGKNAFKGNGVIVEITVGEGIEIINNGCLQNCVSLQKVILPDSLKQICASAFDGCTSLSQIEFGNGLLSIGRGAFLNCANLQEVIIPDSVEKIETMAFANCSNLTKLTIGQNVSNISGYAFKNTALVSAIFKNTEGWKGLTSAQLSDATYCAALLVSGAEMEKI